MAKSLVVGLISGGALVVGASPSSALPRSSCIDQAWYEVQLNTLQNHVWESLDNLYAWQNAIYRHDLVGETWTAFTTVGTGEVHTYNDWRFQQDFWLADYNYTSERLYTFMDTADVCP
jgi:hypothetical protein